MHDEISDIIIIVEKLISEHDCDTFYFNYFDHLCFSILSYFLIACKICGRSERCIFQRAER